MIRATLLCLAASLLLSAPIGLIGLPFLPLAVAHHRRPLVGLALALLGSTLFTGVMIAEAVGLIGLCALLRLIGARVFQDGLVFQALVVLLAGGLCACLERLGFGLRLNGLSFWIANTLWVLAHARLLRP